MTPRERALRATLARAHRAAPGLALYRVSRTRERHEPARSDRTAGWLAWAVLALTASVVGALVWRGVLP